MKGERMKGFIVIGSIVAVICCALSACTKTPPPRYLPSENFGNGGETRCNTIHCHKQLPPCK